MRVESPPFRRPNIRVPGWIIAGIAAWLLIPGAAWWLWRSPAPVVEEIAPVPITAAALVENQPGIASSSALSDERAAEPDARAGVDASTFYTNAFALYDRLTDEEKKMLSSPTEEVDADAALALFEKIQPIMELLRRGAAADYCDWGFGQIDFETPLPQIAKARDLAKLALWNAAYRFPTDAEGAIGDLGVRARLGHDIADTLIGLLVEGSFERSANNLLLQNAATLDATALDEARAFLAGSTMDGDTTLAMQGEASANRATLEKLIAKSADGRKETAATLGLMLYGLNNRPVTPDERASAQRIEEALGDPTRFKSEMVFLTQIQTEGIEAMTWPEDRFRAWWQDVQAKAGDHPLAAGFLPVYDSIHSRLDEARVQRAILGAGLDVVENGTTHLAQARDPVTGRVFNYVSTPGGFELQSAFQFKGKPVTMTFEQSK